MSVWGLGGQGQLLFFIICSGCHKCMSPCGWIWTTCHLALTYLRLNIQTVVSQFQTGTVGDSDYLKSGICCTLISLPMFLGSPRSCNPILTYEVIALSTAIPLSHMFCLAFAVWKDLFIAQANFEDHIIKFGRLQFVERKWQPLKINVNRWT